MESYSSNDLTKCGVYKYAEASDFEVLLFGYSIDGGDVQVVDLACGESLPPDVLAALTDDGVIKWAYNAAFERICLSRYLRDQGVQFDGDYLDSPSWRCTMIWAATLGLPLSLEGAGAVLGLERQKLTSGKDLIRYFCVPRKTVPSSTQGDLVGGGEQLCHRNLPNHAPDKWATFKAYNKRDVEVELDIQSRLAKYPVPDSIWAEYQLDQQINDRGVALDLNLVQQAIAADQSSKAELTAVARDLTGLANPNSPMQLREWLSDQGVEDGDSLDKKAVADLLNTATPEVAEVLVLRQELAKSSVKKYQAMSNAVCADGRARGMFQFYGANRTGRWSGRLVQLQNLPQNHLTDLELARDLVSAGDADLIDLLFGSVPATLSELIRTAFIPKPGHKFIVADFSAIEARVIAWLASEHWRNQVFATHGKIYEASAAQMFKVPLSEITKGSPLRAKGKIAELALGYGGSVGALKAMGALDMGLTEPELQPLVNAWRAANPNIVRFWWAVDKATVTAVQDRTMTQTHGIKFTAQSGMLFITLPSGRRLAYVKPRIGTNQYGSPCVTYEGVGATRKWQRLDTYGPKLVENIVQATARDLLAYAMQQLGHLPIVMHVHDEIVIEAHPNLAVNEVTEAMSQTPAWAEGLLLRADGYQCEFYQKD